MLLFDTLDVLIAFHMHILSALMRTFMGPVAPLVNVYSHCY